MNPILREAILIIFLGILAVILYGYIIYVNNSLKQKFKSLNASICPKKLRERWCQVKNLLVSSNDSSLSRAVMDADKLFDEGLKLSGAVGKNMSDRLKNTKDRFDKKLYSDIWEAHKLRNYYAHDVNAFINKVQAEEAVGAFENGLKALGKL